MHFVLALLSALVGGLLAGPFGFFVAALAGFGLALLWQQSRDLSALRRRVEALESGRRPGSERTPDTTRPPAPQAAAAPRQPTPASIVDQWQTATAATSSRASDHAHERPAAQPRSADRALQRLVPLAAGAIRRLLTQGNPVVRVGVVVLFFGIAFLLRYAWERQLLPVELRLAGVGLGGVLLLALGWRLRHRADTYGLVLQGAGIGILYLTVFATARVYELLPLGAAFGLLITLTAGAAALAVIQNAQALAVFALSGGFLAPVLVSTGTGSHVALFSYYAMLNTGIVAVAWYRQWRWLNWVGFLFTFVIGASWGYRYYRPELFASTQPFLLLFFLYYVGVSVLFARRREVDLRGLVDGTLLFGTPLAAFALQWGLVRDLPFGMAYSALAAALLYAGLALWLRRSGSFGTLLGQSFLALAVAFATLAIPFAFDNQRLTAATWALEGAGLLWVGIRQRQLLPRLAGSALQLAAAAAFLATVGSADSGPFLRNGRFLGALLVGFGGIVCSYFIATNREVLRRFEPAGRWLLLFWGAAWWLYGLASEAARFQPPWHLPGTVDNASEHLFLLLAALSTAFLVMIGRRRSWREAIAAGYLLLPLAALVLAGLDRDWRSTTPLTDLGWSAWPATVATLYWHLRSTRLWPVPAAAWHAGCWWLVAVLLAWTWAGALPDDLAAGSIWRRIPTALVPLAFVAAWLRWRRLGTEPEAKPRWPLERYAPSYSGWGSGIVLGALGLWLLLTGLGPWPPEPLPYVVLCNPLELTQLAILLVAVWWANGLSSEPRRWTFWIIAAVAFLWANLTAARGVHFYAGVDYPLQNLLRSDALQTTLSVLWSSIALALMGLGTRRGWRIGWLAGAGLLAAVLLKLFVHDLSNLALVARIVSFISVGLLMLLIGYLAPLPPATREKS